MLPDTSPFGVFQEPAHDVPVLWTFAHQSELDLWRNCERSAAACCPHPPSPWLWRCAHFLLQFFRTRTDFQFLTDPKRVHEYNKIKVVKLLFTFVGHVHRRQLAVLPGCCQVPSAALPWPGGPWAHSSLHTCVFLSPKLCIFPRHACPVEQVWPEMEHMPTYIHTQTHTCTHANTCTHMHTHIHTHTHTRARANWKGCRTCSSVFLAHILCWGRVLGNQKHRCVFFSELYDDRTRVGLRWCWGWWNKEVR